MSEDEYNELGRLIAENQARQLEEDPIKEGYERVYTDHTGRWYEDIPIDREPDPIGDEIMKILHEEIRKEVDKQILSSLLENIKK